MSTKLYSDIPVYIDGALATEENKVQIERDAGNQEVVTVARGFAGVSPGAMMMRVTVTQAIPAAGFENNLGKKMAARTPVEFTAFCGGQKITQKMYVMSDSLSGGANEKSDMSFVLHGPWADFS